MALGLLLVVAESVLADSWYFPKERYRSSFSEDRKFAVYLIPPKKNTESLLEVVEIKDGEEVLRWKTSLKDQYLPLEVYVTNDGGNVVTYNQIGHAGYGERVLSFYGKDGLIKNHSMEEILHVSKADKNSALRELAPQSISSRWWDRYSIKFFDANSRRLYFCIWLGIFDQWVAWDATTGEQIAIDSKMVGRWKTKARVLAIKKIQEKAEGLPPAQEEAPFVFLASLKRSEDRTLIEQLLCDSQFRTTIRSSKGGILHYTQLSGLRSFAERLLAEWDGRTTGIESPFGDDRQIYYYLGVVDGVVKLPETPKIGDGTLWVLLVPEKVARTDWEKQTPIHRLAATFDKHLLGRHSSKASTNFLFSIEGITPGKYWLKAVWDKAEPRREDYAVICQPQQGDYESLESAVITILAGKVVEEVFVDCTHRVREPND